MSSTLKKLRYALGALVAAVIAFGATACGTERHPATSSSTEKATSSGAARVTIKNYAFLPATIRVRTGGTITFRNLDTTAHTATASDNRSFDSGTINARGNTATIRLTHPGRFAYYCAFHAFMQGTVIVTP